ncbi:MAG: hypothetical protein ABIZ64_04220 [Casimicrobium sp.]
MNLVSIGITAATSGQSHLLASAISYAPGLLIVSTFGMCVRLTATSIPVEKRKCNIR